MNIPQELLATFVQAAFEEAKLAFNKGEVPVGAVVGCKNGIISRAHNLVETYQDPSAHAEMLAIRAACQHFKNWRLLECVLYVTLEPCCMCAGVIRLCRLPVVVFGAKDENLGAFGSRFELAKDARLGPVPDVVGGVAGEDGSRLLKEFFRKRRGK